MPEIRNNELLRHALGLSGNCKPELTSIQRLKQYFNQNAKTGVDPLPQRINVTMTFLCIAAYLDAGGQREAITSTSRDALADRLNQLTVKNWLPEQVKVTCRRAVSILDEQLDAS
ncbi:MAG: hypothetical protein AAGA30_02095 [Planctomycetota bacterium]